MITRAQLRSLGDDPAVYCLYGGRDRRHPAYVGIADRLRVRIDQHLVRRDSSVTTGVATVTLNSDLVTEIEWWRHPTFVDRKTLEAGELVAFQVLDPVLRSRGGVSAAAESLANDPAFKAEMVSLFRGKPAGRLVLPDLSTVLNRLDELEERVRVLESRAQL